MTPLRPIRYWPLLVVAVQLILAFLAFGVLWSHPGWPVNHEEHVFALRSVYYLEEFRRGSFFGLWSPHENFGLGSPLGLFYPRLFSSVAALLLWTGLSVKTALIATLTLFGAAGGTGLYLALRELRLPRLAALLLGGCFCACNYLQTDVILRGAMAEFAAAALLPYLVWWSLRLVNRPQFHYSILPISLLLYFAHATIMLFAGLIPATAVAIAWFRYGDQRRELLKRLLICAGVLGIVILPWLLLLESQRANFLFDIGYVVLNPPLYVFFVKPWGYLPLHWRLPLHGVHVMTWLDAGFLLGMATTWGTLGCLWHRHRDAVRREIRRRWPLWTLLLLPLVLYFVLMDEHSWPFYSHNSLLLGIQFPWRLLTLVTVLGIVFYGLLLKLLHGKLSRPYWYLAALAPPLITILLCGGNALFDQIRRMPIEAISQPQPQNWVEYYPATPKFRDECPPSEWKKLARAWLKNYAARPPEIIGPRPQQFKFKKLPDGSWQLASAAHAPYILILPAAWSDLFLVSDGQNRLGTWRTQDDPRLRIAVPAGAVELTVRIPSWSALFLRQKLPLQPLALPPQ